MDTMALKNTGRSCPMIYKVPLLLEPQSEGGYTLVGFPFWSSC